MAPAHVDAMLAVCRFAVNDYRRSPGAIFLFRAVALAERVLCPWLAPDTGEEERSVSTCGSVRGRFAGHFFSRGTAIMRIHTLTGAVVVATVVLGAPQARSADLTGV
jgi:hypothetical protein